MTSDSHVEAVARAIYAAGRGEFGIRPDHPSERARRIFEQVWQAGGTTDDQRDDIKLCYLQAQAAIEASDAWFQGLGAFKAIYTCTSCGDEFEMTMATVQPCIQCKDGSRLLSIQEIKR